MSAPEINPAAPVHAGRREEILAALGQLTYPAASEEQPGWWLQQARPGPGQTPRPAGTFVIFWFYLHPANPFDRPLCDRVGGDLALSCLAMELQMLNFAAHAQGINYAHGGLVSIVIAP